MDPFVIALVLVSAGLHVAWNIRLKTAGDPLRAATVGMLAASLGIVPVGTLAWWLAGMGLIAAVFGVLAAINLLGIVAFRQY